MRKFLNYNDAIKLLGCSAHPNQLKRRIENFPNHFVEIKDEVYMSKEYFNALLNFHNAQFLLNYLRKGGSHDTL